MAQRILVKMEVKLITENINACKYLLNGVSVTVCKSENYTKVRKDGVETFYTNKNLAFVAWCFSQKCGVSNIQQDAQIDEFLKLTNCI